jgi:hypothetical protein
MLITTILSMTNNYLPRTPLRSAKPTMTILTPTRSTARMMRMAKKAKRKSSNPSVATMSWKKYRSALSGRAVSTRSRKLSNAAR